MYCCKPFLKLLLQQTIKVFLGNKTLDQHLRANSKILFNFSPNLLLFALFQLFSTKNAENDYFDPRLGCAAPKRRLKYTTVFGLACPFWLALPALSCAFCCKSSNQTGKLNQIGCKIIRKTDKNWAGRAEGEMQCATINCCPPKT